MCAVVISCSRGGGTVVLGWGSDEPPGTVYDVRVDGRLAASITTRGSAPASIRDEHGDVRQTNAPVEIDVEPGTRKFEITRNGKPHWSRDVVVNDGQTEFYFSLPDARGEGVGAAAK